MPVHSLAPFTIALALCSMSWLAAGCAAPSVGDRALALGGDPDGEEIAGTPDAGTLTAEPALEDTSATPPPAGAPFNGPTWKMATLVFRQTEVDVVDPGGATRHVSAAMSADRYMKAQAAAAAVPGSFEKWNGGRAHATMTVVDVPTLRKVSRVSAADGGYSPAPADVTEALADFAPLGRYDSVFVLWEPGSGASSVPACCARGRGPGADTNGMTYATVTPNTGAEGMIREWLHAGSAFFKSKGFDVPAPDESRAFGFPTSVSSSWSHWYAALLSSRLVREGKVVGYTEGVWRTGTPTMWVGGTVPAVARPALPKPVIRDAKKWDADWLYAEWDPTPGTTHYSLFLVAKRPDGTTKSLHSFVPGSQDRGAFNYHYWSMTDACKLGKGKLKMSMQIWSDSDDNSAVDREVGTINCQ